MYGFFILLAVIGVLWALRRASRMTPAESRKFGMKIFAWALLLLSGFFVLHGNFLLGLPAFGIAAGMLGLNRYLPQPTPQQQSRQQATPPRSTRMGASEALDVLGLSAGATTDEIKAAHKRLQRTNHPDTGGSTYLAAKINEARDVLLAR